MARLKPRPFKTMTFQQPVKPRPFKTTAPLELHACPEPEGSVAGVRAEEAARLSRAGNRTEAGVT